MNNCLFTGFLCADPEIEIADDSGGAEHCKFTLLIYEYFRNKMYFKINEIKVVIHVMVRDT